MRSSTPRYRAAQLVFVTLFWVFHGVLKPPQVAGGIVGVRQEGLFAVTCLAKEGAGSLVLGSVIERCISTTCTCMRVLACRSLWSARAMGL
jgi:hypothetical protein